MRDAREAISGDVLRKNRSKSMPIPRGIRAFLTPVLIPCLFWSGVSSKFNVYHAVYQGQRYGNLSLELKVENFEECHLKCVMIKASQACYAFNHNEKDGSCQLIHNGKSHLVPSTEYQAYVQFLCLTDYPRIENAEESFDGWTGKHPAPRGGMVNFSCKHPRGFRDGQKDHQATCSSFVADAWCATFIENEKDLCPPPQSCVAEYPSIENATVTYDRWDGKYPAPPGSSVIYTCPHSSRFNDGSDVHNATCSFRIDDTWNSSFQDRHVRCQDANVTDAHYHIDTGEVVECRMTTMGMEYRGTRNQSQTGKECRLWAENYFTADITTIRDDKNIFSSPNEQYLQVIIKSLDLNYCRNPTMLARPWCFVLGGTLDWEYCDIPFCSGREGLRSFDL
ncbi:unnamed protein product [Darwinula stevensoni]|uniref:Kringle domain-containing protein n=1 Tax=Darwinula stevensoni TaxID=69355 RepID=A0A7R9A736_9CRUS|nr:unnamed protein product [Darwinula stevensoni]CAG0891348.1 unnamed protein product [Darwinula stevensoni]